MAYERANLQQLERTSEEGPSGGLSSGADRRDSPSNDDPPLAVNAARPGEREPSRGAAGGSTVMGNGKNNIHSQSAGVQLEKLQKKNWKTKKEKIDN